MLEPLFRFHLHFFSIFCTRFKSSSCSSLVVLLLFVMQAFSIVIEEFDGLTGKWHPYKADDVQLEFVMIDPYIRVNLKASSEGKYTTTFQVPDVYGVFKFVIDYHRVGYSNLDIQQQVSVHPFRHNEFERFIDVAYPYYLSAFTIMAAFFIFGVLFLYQKDSSS